MAKDKASFERGRYSYEFDPFEMAGLDRDRDLPRDVLEDIADYVQTKMLDKIGAATSPLAGQARFKALSKEYAKFKRDFGPAKPNLELYGDMLDAFEARPISSRNSIKLEFNEREQSLKAENHNEGKTLPARPFFPRSKDEQLKADIRQGVRGIIRDYLAESEDG